MLRVALIAALIALATPASAACVARSYGGDDGYPRGQDALLFCQQRELSESVEDRALAEQLRMMQSRLQALELQQKRLVMPRIEPFALPRL